MDDKGLLLATLIVDPRALDTYILRPGREVELSSYPDAMKPALKFVPMPFLGVEAHQSDAEESIRTVQRPVEPGHTCEMPLL